MFQRPKVLPNQSKQSLDSRLSDDAGQAGKLVFHADSALSDQGARSRDQLMEEGLRRIAEGAPQHAWNAPSTGAWDRAKGHLLPQARIEAAARAAGAEKVQQLLASRVDPEMRDSWGRTMLHYAAMTGNGGGVQALLYFFQEEQREQFVNVVDVEGKSALYLATRTRKEGQGKIIDLLIQHKADPNGVDHQKRTPLHIARDGEMVKALIRGKAKVDCADCLSRTPLHLALKYNGSQETVDELLKCNAQIDVKDQAGNEPIHLGALMGHYHLVQFLIKRGEEKQNFLVHHLGDKGRTPLFCAADGGHLKTVRMLLSMGATQKPDGSYLKQYPIHVAAANGYASVVKELLTATQPDCTDMKNVRDGQHKTPLLTAAKKHGTAAVVQELKEKKADLNACDEEGFSAITRAAETGNAEMFMALMNDAQFSADDLALLIKTNGEDSAQVLDRLLVDPLDPEWKKEATKLKTAYLSRDVQAVAGHRHLLPEDEGVKMAMAKIRGSFSGKWVVGAELRKCSLKVIEVVNAQELTDCTLVAAFAYTHGEKVLASSTTDAILSIASRRVLGLCLFDYMIKGLALGAMMWTANCLAYSAPIPSGPMILLGLKCCKSGVERLAQLCTMLPESNGREFCQSSDFIFGWLVVLLDALGVVAMSQQASSVFWTCVLAAETLSVWFVFSYGLRLIPGMGEEMLPIFAACWDSLHFFLLLFTAIGAWVHSFYIIGFQVNGSDVYTNAYSVMGTVATQNPQPNNYEALTNNFLLNITAGQMTQGTQPATNFHTSIQIIWLAVVLTCVLVLLNILVGVLSDAYDKRRRQSAILFARTRARQIVYLHSSPLTKAVTFFMGGLRQRQQRAMMQQRRLDRRRRKEAGEEIVLSKISWTETLLDYIAWTPNIHDFIWVCQALSSEPVE